MKKFIKKIQTVSQIGIMTCADLLVIGNFANHLNIDILYVLTIEEIFSFLRVVIKETLIRLRIARLKGISVAKYNIFRKFANTLENTSTL